jgi:hypothetical protein
VVVPPRIRARPIPQFGDAGYGINELFGPTPACGAERPAVGIEPELKPTPVRGSARFVKQVRAQAGPVLERASTWVELERGLVGHGLSLRLKGGGFVLTDGVQEVKVSDVGRAFSRLHLENRLGRWPQMRHLRSRPRLRLRPWCCLPRPLCPENPPRKRSRPPRVTPTATSSIKPSAAPALRSSAMRGMGSPIFSGILPNISESRPDLP